MVPVSVISVVHTLNCECDTIWFSNTNAVRFQKTHTHFHQATLFQIQNTKSAVEKSTRLNPQAYYHPSCYMSFMVTINFLLPLIKTVKLSFLMLEKEFH
jgi:hypothetical protein